MPNKLTAQIDSVPAVTTALEGVSFPDWAVFFYIGKAGKLSNTMYKFDDYLNFDRVDIIDNFSARWLLLSFMANMSDKDLKEVFGIE